MGKLALASISIIGRVTSTDSSACSTEELEAITAGNKNPSLALFSKKKSPRALTAAAMNELSINCSGGPLLKMPVMAREGNIFFANPFNS